MTRRQALAGFASWLAASPLARGQSNVPTSRGEAPGRIAPVEELANAYEFAQMAERSLGVTTFAKIADSEREVFDQITFRMRLMVNTTNLDLTSKVMGQDLFTPFIIGPAAHQRRFHADGELAMSKAAASAKAVMVLSQDSDFGPEQLAGQPFWYQAYPTSNSLDPIKQAVQAGSKAICLTVGMPRAPADWAQVDRIRQAVDVPVALKGVLHIDDAKKAADAGLDGIVVSSHGGRFVHGLAHPMSVLGPIAEAVGDKISVMVDGGFRRGSDALKALALGADGVMISRPALWGLSAYGEAGVKTVVELLQTELAADMAMLGAVNVEAVTRESIRIDRP